MHNPKFQVVKNPRNGRFYYHLSTRNGEKILSSEGFTTKQACLAGIAAVQLSALYDLRYDKANGYISYTFTLKGVDGEVIGRSHHYTLPTCRDTGIATVKSDAPVADVEDLT